MGRSSQRRKRLPFKMAAMGTALFAILFGLVVLIGVQLIRFESERHQQREIEQVTRQLDVVATALKHRIYANIFAVSGVKSLVAMNPELNQDDFTRAMEIQFREHADLRNIGLAREMTLRLMYPIEDNEAAIGLDYRSLPDQIAAVEEALETNRIVLAGPLPLVQGGEGLIARIPIHVSDATSGQERFWGFASVVMNADAIFAGAGVGQHGSLGLSIRGKEARGANGEVFFGDPGVFDRQPVTQLIELPHGSWQMGAEPAGGWTRYSAVSDRAMWAYLAAAVAILGFAGLTVFLLTKNKLAGEALRIAEERLEKTAYELTENIPVGTYSMVQAADGGMPRFAFMSSRFLELTGLTREEAASDLMKAFACVHPDDLDAWVAKNVESFNEKKSFFGETRVVVKGEARWVAAESFPRSLSDGTTVWEGVLADVTDRKLAEQQLELKTELLEKLSMQDGLTAIANRRYFDQRADAEWRRVLRTGMPLSLLLLDIDDFKAYNDHYGHAAGDDCLRRVAQALAGCVERPLDLVARYGGEEFGVLTPETGLDGALHLAGRMRAAVELMAIAHARSRVAEVVTVSIGVAAHGPDRVKRDWRELRERADQALYQAKRQGRNQIQGEDWVHP